MPYIKWKIINSCLKPPTSDYYINHHFPMLFPWFSHKKTANNSYWALETNQHGFKGWLPRVTSQKRASPVTTTCPYRFPKWIPPAKWSSHHRLSKCRDRKSTENIILYIHISYCDISQYIPMKYPHIVAFLFPWYGKNVVADIPTRFQSMVDCLPKNPWFPWILGTGSDDPVRYVYICLP